MDLDAQPLARERIRSVDLAANPLERIFGLTKVKVGTGETGSGSGSANEQTLALDVQRRLLAQGYIVSLGGGRRESIVLTPPLDIGEPLLEGFLAAFRAALEGALR